MPNFLEFWYAALASSIGVVIRTNDPDGAKRQLYKAREEAQDLELKKVSIVTSPVSPATDLWLLKRSKE